METYAKFSRFHRLLSLLFILPAVTIGCKKHSQEPTSESLLLPANQLTKIGLVTGDIYWNEGRAETEAMLLVKNASTYSINELELEMHLYHGEQYLGEYSSLRKSGNSGACIDAFLVSEIPPSGLGTVECSLDLPRNLARSEWKAVELGHHHTGKLVLQTRKAPRFRAIFALDEAHVSKPRGEDKDLTYSMATTNALVSPRQFGQKSTVLAIKLVRYSADNAAN